MCQTAGIPRLKSAFQIVLEEEAGRQVVCLPQNSIEMYRKTSLSRLKPQGNIARRFLKVGKVLKIEAILRQLKGDIKRKDHYR